MTGRNRGHKSLLPVIRGEGRGSGMRGCLITLGSPVIHQIFTTAAVTYMKATPAASPLMTGGVRKTSNRFPLWRIR
jgi:hypothetical protein